MENPIPESERPSWRRLIAFLYGVNGPQMLVLIPLDAVQSLIPVATVYLTSTLVDTLTAGEGGVLRILALQGLLLVLGQIAGDISGWLRTLMQQRVEFRLMEQLYTKLQEVPHELIEQPPFQDLLRRMRNSITQMGTGFFETVMAGGRGLVTIAGYLFILGQAHWLLPVGMIVLAGASTLLMGRTGVRNQAQFVEHNKYARHIDYLWNLPTVPHMNREVKLFGLWPFIYTRWEALWTRVQREKLTLTLRNDITALGASVLSMGAVFGVYLYLVWGVTDQTVTVGGFVALSAAAVAAMGQIDQISQTYGQGVERWLQSADALAFLEMKFPAEGSAPLQIKNPDVGIRCERMTFSYPTGTQPSLREVSLHLRPGERVMVVGENGSGKSTLVKLLAGLYQPKSGTITYQGCPIGPDNIKSYQQEVGALFQDFGQYDMTGYENLALGSPDRLEDRDALETVARRVGAAGFLEALPARYETVLGHWLGKPLSLGQWQRIALARVMLRDAPVLILDEPASALDPGAQADIFDQLLAPDTDRIRLFVSHDPDARRWADRIIVMKDGVLLEDGDHEELLAKGGEYARLYRAHRPDRLAAEAIGAD